MRTSLSLPAIAYMLFLLSERLLLGPTSREKNAQQKASGILELLQTRLGQSVYLSAIFFVLNLKSKALLKFRF